MTSGFIAKIETIAILRIWPDIWNGDKDITFLGKPNSNNKSKALFTSSTFIPKFLGPNSISLSILSSNNCDSGN